MKELKNEFFGIFSDFQCFIISEICVIRLSGRSFNED